MTDDFSEAGRAGMQPGWRMTHLAQVYPLSQAELWPASHVCPSWIPFAEHTPARLPGPFFIPPIFTLCCGNYLPWEISPIAINRCARIYCDDNSPDSCDCDSKLCSTGKGHISVHSDQCYRSLPNWKQLLLPAHRDAWPLTFKRWQWRDPPSSFILAVDLFPKTPSLSPAPFSSIFLCFQWHSPLCQRRPKIRQPCQR